MAMRFQLLFFVFRIGSNRPCAIMPMAFGIVGLKTSSNSKQNLDSREKKFGNKLGQKIQNYLKLFFLGLMKMKSFLALGGQLFSWTKKKYFKSNWYTNLRVVVLFCNEPESSHSQLSNSGKRRPTSLVVPEQD